MLTLLAVITGLTVAVEPARAVDAGVQTVRLSETVEAYQAQAIAQSEGREYLRFAGQRREADRKPPTITIYVPTVMLKADRARE
ncbi:hypothetical protein GCM10009127_21840 [Alteraurantiacibacter aestuarii]